MACTALGFLHASPATSSVPVNFRALPQWITNLACVGTEMHPLNCTVNSGNPIGASRTSGSNILITCVNGAKAACYTLLGLPGCSGPLVLVHALELPLLFLS